MDNNAHSLYRQVKDGEELIQKQVLYWMVICYLCKEDNIEVLLLYFFVEKQSPS